MAERKTTPRPLSPGLASPGLADALTIAAEGSERSRIQSFMVMDVMRAASAEEAAGRNIVHMEVGQPGTQAPQAARRAAVEALQRDTLGYTVALGSEPLRARIAQLYQDWYGVNVAPERIVVTTGSSAAFVLAFLALFDVGDAVGLPTPGYPCYRHILSALGQRPVLIATGPETGWMPTAEAVARAATEHGIKGLLIASPANPTGTMITPDRLQELIGVCRKYGVRFISDEIYHGLTYDRPAQTALAHDDDAIIINSFSKYFSMTGWRVGWMVAPQRLMPAMERLAQNLYISAPAVAQAAALGAFDGVEELEANRTVYAQNRALLMQELPKAGFGTFAPADGAFYLYCDVGDMTNDAAAYTQAMLLEAGVAATPGVDFDGAHGNRFVRFCYAGTASDMAEGARRILEWSRARGQA
jgi:aspartate/methionine/tyrosine aminotransferase